MSEPLPGDEASTGTGPVGQVSFAAPGVLPPYSAGMYPPLDGALGAEAPMWLWSPELSAGTTRGGRASTGLTIGVHGSLDAYAPRPPLPMAFKPVPVPAPMGAPSCSPWDRQAVAERGGSFGWGRPSAGASRTAEQPWRTHSALPAWPGGGGSADPLWWPTEATQAAPELNLQALMHLLHEDGGSASTASVETGEYASAHPADYPPHAPQHPSWPEHELALRRPLQAQLHAAQPQLAAQHVAQPYGSLHYPPPLYPPPAFSSPPRAPDGMLGSGGLPLMPMLIPEQLAVLASMPPVARPDGGAMSANDMWLQMPQSHMLQQHAAMRSMSAHPPLPSSSTSLCSCDSNSSGSSAGASQPSSLFSSATSSYATSATSSASRVPSLPLSSGQGHCLLSALTAAPPLLPTYPPHATLPGPPAGTLDPASAGFGPSDLPPHYHSSAALAQLPLAHISPASLLQAVHASYLYSQAGQIPPHEPQPPYAPGAAPHGYTEQNSAASSVHSHDGRRSRSSAGSRTSPTAARRRPADEQAAKRSNDDQRVELSKVLSGLDQRATLMLRHIPNKYSQRMLLCLLEKNHRGKFDLLYLPIDSKNKCNMGYAFINFTSYLHVPAFYEEFRGKKWDRFNSDKVAQINYARIQGLDDLSAHFSNSSLADQDESVQPALFSSDGLGTRRPFCKPAAAPSEAQP